MLRNYIHLAFRRMIRMHAIRKPSNVEYNLQWEPREAEKQYGFTKLIDEKSLYLYGCVVAELEKF